MGLDNLILLGSVAGATAASAGALAWTIYARWFVKVPPNRALVLYGRQSPRLSSEPGVPPADVNIHKPRIVVGGRVFVAPWNKGVGRLSLDPITVDLSVRSMEALQGSRASGWEVGVRVQTKIPAEPGALTRAAENLLGKTDEEVQTLIGRTVEAAVPAVLSRFRLEEVGGDWDHLAAQIQASVAPDLVAMGLVIRGLSVTELKRILPADSAPAVSPPRRLSLPEPTGDPPPREGFRSPFDASEARGGRGLEGREGTGVTLQAEARPDGARVSPISVLDLPLGWEAALPGSGAYNPFPSLHESTGGDRSHPTDPLSKDSRGGEGAGNDPAPSD